MVTTDKTAADNPAARLGEIRWCVTHNMPASLWCSMGDAYDCKEVVRAMVSRTAKTGYGDGPTGCHKSNGVLVRCGYEADGGPDRCGWCA